MRRAAKVDDTQAAIVDALRAAGCKVLSLAAMGNGCADLLILAPGIGEYGPDAASSLMLLEVKNLQGRGKKLTPDQIEFHAEWPVTVVTNPAEALRAVGL